MIGVDHDVVEQRVVEHAPPTAQIAGFAAKLGAALLPTPLPEVAAVASGQVAQAYDLDYRQMGRLAYAPLRTACDAAVQAALVSVLAVSPQNP